MELLPQVTVLSRSQLFLDAPQVREERLGEGDERVFRYTGLRLLEYADSRHFLVSDGWTREYGVVMALEVGEGIRVEYVRRHG